MSAKAYRGSSGWGGPILTIDNNGWVYEGTPVFPLTGTPIMKISGEIVHELLIRLDDESILGVPSCIESLIQRHQRICQECKRRNENLLDACQRSSPPEKQERLTEIGLLLAGRVTEQLHEEKHIRRAVEAAISQVKVEPGMEAIRKVLKRHRILEQLAEARARGEPERVVDLARELQLQTLADWAERA